MLNRIRPNIGCEMECFVVDKFSLLLAEGRRVMALIHEMKGFMTLRLENVGNEYLRCQIELGSAVFETISEMRNYLAKRLSKLIERADELGLRIVPLATWPGQLKAELPFTPKDRYVELRTKHPDLTGNGLVANAFQCHIGGFGSKEEALQAWQATLFMAPVLQLLLSGSPFYNGKWENMASNRARRWKKVMPSDRVGLPTPAIMESLSVYEADLEGNDNFYWPASKLHLKYNTIEFRCMDMVANVNQWLMAMALCQAAVHAFQTGQLKGITQTWDDMFHNLRKAEIEGMACGNIAGLDRKPQTAPSFVRSVVNLLNPSLEELGGQELVTAEVGNIINFGTTAQQLKRQRSGKLITPDHAHSIIKGAAETFEDSVQGLGQSLSKAA